MKTRVFLIAILVLAFALRFYRFNITPPSLYWDEVSIGFNAWSILTTGNDEYGYRLPLFFESFQEYKLPGYIYSTVPFIALFGLNEMGVRFPSVIFGVLAVWGIYLFVSTIFHKKTALLAAFLLTIAPWHILFSRAGFEANAGLTVLIFAFYFFYKNIKNGKFPALGLFLLIFSQYFYNSLRVFVPPVLLIFFVIFWNRIRLIKTKIIFPFIFSCLLYIPLLIKFFQPEALNRFSYVSIFNNQTFLQDSVERRIFDHNSIIAKIIHHRYLVYAKEITKNYLSHFSFDFLFFGKDYNSRHNIPNVGLIYLWLTPFIFIGTYSLIKRKDRSLVILIPWLFIAPFAASIVSPTPHALRTLLILPPILIFSSYGLSIFLKYGNNIYQNKVIYIVVALSIFSSFNLFHQMLVHYSYQVSKEWAYGYKEVFSFIKEKKSSYNNIYVTGKYWRPYIFALFYLRYPPDKYYQDISHSKLDNIYFGHADYDTSDPYFDYQVGLDIKNKLRKEKNSLLVLSPEEIISEDKVILTVSDLHNKPLFLFVDNK